MKLAGPQDLKKKYNASWALVTVGESKSNKLGDATGH